MRFPLRARSGIPATAALDNPIQRFKERKWIQIAVFAGGGVNLSRNALWLLAIAAAQPALAGNLFEATIPLPDSSPPTEHLSAWYAVPDVESLQLAPTQITLNIPGQAPVVATLEHFEHRAGYIDLGVISDDSDFIVDPAAGPEDMSWRWEGKAQGWVVAMTMHKGVLAGRITGPQARYEIAPSPEGQTLLGLVNPNWWSTHGDEGDPAEPLLAELDAMQAAPTSGPSPELPASPDYCTMPVPTQTQVIDVGVVIDPSTLIPYGGVSGVTAMVQASIDDANLVLSNSGVSSVRFRMGEPILSAQTYASSIGTALNQFTGVAPLGAFPWLQVDPNHPLEGMRDVHGYDVLALARRDPNLSCGLARAQRWVTNNGYPQQPGESYARLAYLVFDPGCNADRLNLAHELGHTLGMEHDPMNAVTGSTPGFNPSCNWSHAHRVGPQGLVTSSQNVVPERFRFRTVMAYSVQGPNSGDGPPGCRLAGQSQTSDSLCPVIDVFGNPAIEWAGWSGTGGGPFGLQPAGTVPGAYRTGANPPSIATHEPAHGADTVARLGPVVAQFRTVDIIWANSFD